MEQQIDNGWEMDNLVLSMEKQLCRVESALALNLSDIPDAFDSHHHGHAIHGHTRTDNMALSQNVCGVNGINDSSGIHQQNGIDETTTPYHDNNHENAYSSDLFKMCTSPDPAGCGEEVEYELSQADHPRLANPFYDELRSRYPRAFRRKGSASSVASDVSSVYGARRKLKTKPPVRGDKSSLPPRPPVGGTDGSISGTPRRSSYHVPSSPRTEYLHSIRRASVCSDVDDTRSVTSTMSLKDRLDRNKESWRDLLFKENVPVRRKLGKRMTRSREIAQPVENGAVKPPTDHTLSLLDLRAKLERDLNSLPEDSHNTSDAGKHSAHQSRAKRYASPDSQNDSAVDMETGSAHCSPADRASAASKQRHPHSPHDPSFSSPPPLCSTLSATGGQTLDTRLRGVPPPPPPRDDGTHALSDALLSSLTTPPPPAPTKADSDVDSGISPPPRANLPASMSSNDDDTDSALHFHRSRESRTQEMTSSRGRFISSDNVPRSRSSSRKREKVTFEDEVIGGLAVSQRTHSQPSLHHGRGHNDRSIESSLDSGSEFSDVHTESAAAPSRRRRVLKLKCYSQQDLRSPSRDPSPVSQSHQHLHHVHPAASPLPNQSSMSRKDKSVSMSSLPPASTAKPPIGRVRSPRGNTMSDTRSHRTHPSRGGVTSERSGDVSDRESLRGSGQSDSSRTRRTPHQRTRSSDRNGDVSDRESLRGSIQGDNIMSDVEVAAYLDRASQKKKKSKLPWKRNKGRFTPKDEVEKLGADVGERSLSVMSLNSDTASVRSAAVSQASVTSARSNKPPAGARKQKQRPKSAPPSKPPSSNGKRFSSGYEEVNFEATDSSELRISDVPENTYETVGAATPYPGNASSESNESDGSVEEKDLYTKVDRNRILTTHHAHDTSDDNADEYLPSVPERGYESNLVRSKALSASQTSLGERMGSLRKSAAKQFQKLRRAVSTEKLEGNHEPAAESSRRGKRRSAGATDEPGQLKKSPSLRSLQEKLSFRKKKGEKREGATTTENRKHSKKPPLPPGGSISRGTSKEVWAALTSEEGVEHIRHFRPIGKVKAQNPDGTLQLELQKPPHGPYGFYVARGVDKYKHALLISKLNESLPGHFYAGMISIGDEILEINGLSVCHLTLEEVHELVATSDKLLMKTLPLSARSDL